MRFHCNSITGSKRRLNDALGYTINEGDRDVTHNAGMGVMKHWIFRRTNV